MPDGMSGVYDANGVDGFTILVGIVVMMAKVPVRHIRGHKPAFSKGKCATDLLNGITLVPFALMVLAAYSKTLLTELIHSNMVLVATAGAIGIIFVVGEILKTEAGP